MDATTRVGVRLRAELLRRLDATRREEVRADDLADFDQKYAPVRAKLEAEIRQATLGLEGIDEARRAFEEEP